MYNPDYQASLNHSCYKSLNQNQLKFATDFYPNNDGTFTSNDPRLVDVMRGYRMDLNAPAFDGTPLSIERDAFTKIEPQTYGSYKDIIGGQVYYYEDDYLKQPYFSPNFQLRSYVKPSVYQDPMGSLKPQYVRTPLAETGYISDYTFDQDQISFREDIMSLQMRVQNQSNWSLYQNSTDIPYHLTNNPNEN